MPENGKGNRPVQVVCPHCKKPFTSELIGTGERYRGFKCPHCKLFVSAGNAVEPEPPGA